MQSGNGNGMQDAQSVGEGSDRQFSRQRGQLLHGLYLGEGIKSSLDNFFSGFLDELSPSYPEEEHYITGVDIRIGTIAKTSESNDHTVQAGFLLHFTHDGGIGRFIALDKPTRQGPITAVWFLIALNKEDCGGIPLHYDSPDAQRIVSKVDKTTAALLRDTVWSFAPLNGV